MAAWARSRILLARGSATLMLLLAAAPALSQFVSDRANERAEVRLPAGEAVTAGRLRVLGEYLSGRKAWTSTVLPDGGVLLFGDRVLNDALRRHGEPVITLRNRFDHGSEARVAPHAEPLLWRGDGKGWQRLPRPPGCKGNSFMPTATRMGDGRVLMAGGLCDRPRMANDTSPRTPHVATSIWNAATQAWESGPDLTRARVRHSATALPDGSVLLVGGHSDPALSQVAGNPAPVTVGPGTRASVGDLGHSLPVLASVERFEAGRMQTMPSLSIARAGHTATALQDGSVLVVGGRGATGEALDSAELWDAGAGSWLLLPPMAAARHAHSATRLSDGRVLVVGGENGGGPSPEHRLLPSSEIFDPATRRWSPGPRLPRALREHAAVLLRNGAVLLAGGRQFSPSAYSEPWAWVLDAGQQRWLPAGNATVSRYDEEWQVTPDLEPLADGRVRIFAGIRVLLWSPRPPVPEIAPPAWSRTPAAVALASGEVLVVGHSSPASGAEQTHAYLWDPRARRWSAASRPGFSAGPVHGLAQLRSGRIVHVGADGDSRRGHRLQAHCLMPPQDEWRACGEAALPASAAAAMAVGTLPDGRLAIVANQRTGAIYDEDRQAFTVGELLWQTEELGYRAPIKPTKPLAQLKGPEGGAAVDVSPLAAQFWDGDAGVRFAFQVTKDGSTVEDRSAERPAGPRMLWDPAKNLWTYILPRERMGGQAALLPDGCAISIDPPSVFDPTTAKVRWLPDPGIGLERGSGRVLVLPDGEIVAVGMPASGVGPGLYQTRAGCAGFAADPDEALRVEARSVDDPRFRIETAPAAPVVAASDPPSRLRDPLSRWWPSQPLWVAAAVLLPVLAYLLLSRVVNPRLKAAARRRVSPAATGIFATRLPSPVAWGVRLIIYIPLSILLLAWLGQILLVREFNEGRMDHERCEVDPRACVDARTGLIASVPELEGMGTPKALPQIPCRFVGVWSTRDSLRTYNVTLMDDGRLRIDDQQPGVRRQTDGLWMVQGGHLVRRYPYPGQTVADVRRLVMIDADTFELLTREGDVSRFSLVERRESSRCVR
jgi:hypothetical protein